MAKAVMSQPDKSVLFMARRESCRLALKQRYPTRDPVSGQPTGMTEGIFVGFRENAFRCPTKGKVTLRDTLDGGEATVDAEWLLDRLLNHRLYGDMWEGFWRVDPAAPPVSQEEQDALMDAAIRLDIDALRRVLYEEEQGWKRDVVLRTARRGIEQIEETHRAYAEEKAAEEAAAKGKGAPKAEG